MESLANSFLIATPQMVDPRFRQQVVYLCEHTSEGAMGVAINYPHEDLTLQDIFQGAKMPMADITIPPVYHGGPVDEHAGYILFQTSTIPEQALQVSPTVAITPDIRMLEKIAAGQGPENYLFLLGYCGWGPGQLEAELTTSCWLTVPAQDRIIFHTPDQQKWKAAARSIGVDITMIGDIVGNA